MIDLPRIALAVPPQGPEPSIASLALMAGLTSGGVRVQHFRSRACPFGTELVHNVTGLPGRHLDAWLMPPDVLGRVLARGARNADLALVEGTLSDPCPGLDCRCIDRPGGLAPIAGALQIPTILVVEAPAGEPVHLPHVPAGVDALLIDGLEQADDFPRIARFFELFLRKPVIGAVETLPAARAALESVPRDFAPSPDLMAALGRSFLRFADVGKLQQLARSRPLPVPVEPVPHAGRHRFRVAYALDDAFGNYFPDTLETLESLGADLVGFSPIRDERLPDAVNLVMIGCGHPEDHMDALASNFSMIASLRQHVCRGQRIYSEGGGTAYLGQSLTIGDSLYSGVGILPFDVTLRPQPEPPRPVERRLTADTWLGPRDTVVRGYLSGRWEVRHAATPCEAAARFGPLTGENDIHFFHHAVGGFIHLHLGALPEVVDAFVGPHRPSLTLKPGER